MILLNSLMVLLSIVIVLHFIKYLKDRNKKREGFSEFKSEEVTINPAEVTHNTIVNKMKNSNTNKNKNNIKNSTKSKEEIKSEQHNQRIVSEIKDDIKEIMSINDDIKKLNESFKSRK